MIEEVDISYVRRFEDASSRAGADSLTHTAKNRLPQLSEEDHIRDITSPMDKEPDEPDDEIRARKVANIAEEGMFLTDVRRLQYGYMGHSCSTARALTSSILSSW